MQHEKMRGHPILIIRQDNAGENKNLVTLAHLKEWKLETKFKNTAGKTPQQISYAELAFTVIAAKTRAVMNATQIPKSKRFKMWGKGMHMMQYSRPDTYNAVHNLARHVTKVTQVHYDAMLRMMKYVDDTSDRGLVLNPMRKWDGNKEHEFIISGRSDSDYAKDAQTQKSISGYRVLLEGAHVMFKSSTQESVAISVCEAEQTAGVSCAQDMLYVRHILESMGRTVKLPMSLEMDNMGAVDLANNWSVGGRT